MPNLYDKTNKNLITSGAFVTEVFQNSNVYFIGEIHEGKLEFYMSCSSCEPPIGRRYCTYP